MFKAFTRLSRMVGIGHDSHGPLMFQFADVGSTHALADRVCRAPYIYVVVRYLSIVKTLSRPEINNFRRLLNETLRHVTAPRISAAVTCYAMLIRLGANP